jgi:type IV secretory pathway VirB9-like protein
LAQRFDCCERSWLMRSKFMACLVLAAAGCAGPRVVQYAQPMRADGTALPVVRLDDVSPPFRRDPMEAVDHDVIRERVKGGATEKDPHLIMREANADAYTAPEEGEAEGHTQVYLYAAEKEFPVYACAKRNVVLQLAPGEHVSGEPDMGNSRGWSHLQKQSGDGHGNIVEVVLFRPAREDLDRQYAQIFTNVGPYYLELNVLATDETSCMRAVRWRHPERELQRLIADDDQRKDVKTKSAETHGCVSANYEIEILEGSPRWVPTFVWRTCDGDHARVHIQFNGDVSWSKIPSLKSDGGVVDYQYVPEDHVMVVEGLFTRGLLSLGSKEQGYERVSIRALKDPR